MHNSNELHKIMLLGDSAVGKSSILLRFSDNTFSENFVSTIGIDFRLKSVEIEGNPIKIQCWDTAGQERFHSLNLSYYRNVDGFVVVFDITDENSFNNIENWLRGISEAATKEYSSILIGNKIDLEDKRVISSQKGRQLAKKHNMKYIETSALNGTNVDQAFMCLAQTVHEQRCVNMDAIQTIPVQTHQKPITITLRNSLGPTNGTCC